MRSFVPALALLLIACGSDSRPPFERAEEAAANAKFRDAAKWYAQVGTPDAELRLANIEWRVFGDARAARARLERLLQSEKAFDARLELSRIDLVRGRYAVAESAAREAEKVAKTSAERRRALLAQARAIVEQATAVRPVNTESLRTAIAALRSIIAAEGPRLEPARLLARAGLLAGDRVVMMEGIDGYYHVSQFSGPPQLIAAAYAQLASAPDDASLARALAGIRFFDEAALVAPPQSEIARYAAMLQRMEAIADEHYRQTALGNESARALKKALAAELKRLWPTLDFDDAVAEMGKRFGGYLILGETGGFADTHIAHKVADGALAVEQYGHKATVRFIVLDGVVSNGFQSWRTDGRSGDGGWGTKAEIYQVRPLYADDPLQEWMGATDPEARAKYRKEGEPPTFEGLEKRLRLQYLDRVRAETNTGEAFLARIEADTFHYSIHLHEGRHAIDDASGESYRTWELEYRAKLSQVALANAPRPALASIVGDTIGGDAPHGKANEKIIRELTAWLKTHAPHVKSVMQLDQLTDEQIRAAFASLDPLARG
ncbi:MAG TPA: hypothetical protein VGF48_13060 [Thermoanaerobaculia bacterium]|jgi:hypothetical protein